MKKLFITSTTLFLVLSGCSSMSIVQFPEPPSMPVEWGQYDVTLLSVSQCPNLKGKYSFPEVKVVVEQKIEHHEGVEFSDYFGLIPWALAERRPGTISTDESEEFLRIEQPSAKSTEIELLLSGDLSSNYYNFEGLEGDFICEEGVLKFPLRHSFGGIEGSTLNGQVRVSVRKAGDGALVFLRTHGIYRSRDVSENSGFIHEFYRFSVYPTAIDEH